MKNENNIDSKDRKINKLKDEIFIRDTKLLEIQDKLMTVLPELVDIKEFSKEKKNLPEINETIEKEYKEVSESERKYKKRKMMFIFGLAIFMSVILLSKTDIRIDSYGA